MMQYRIVGRFEDDEKSHVVDSDPRWSREDAEKRLAEIKRKEDQRNGREHVTAAGTLTVSCGMPKLIELKIQSREVTPWKAI